MIEEKIFERRRDLFGDLTVVFFDTTSIYFEGNGGEVIVASLKDKLKRGNKSLVGNKGYRKYLKTEGGGFGIDEEKVKREDRYDGKWVLITNTDLSARQVALQYKKVILSPTHNSSTFVLP